MNSVSMNAASWREPLEVLEPGAKWELVATLPDTGVIRIIDVRDDEIWFLNVEKGVFFVYDGEGFDFFIPSDPFAQPKGARFLNDTDILVADKNLGLCKFLPYKAKYFNVATECDGVPFDGINSVCTDGYGGAYVTDAGDSSYFKRDGKVYYVWFRDGGFDVELFVEGAAFPSCVATSADDNDVFVGEFATNAVIAIASKVAPGRVETPSIFSYSNKGHGPTGLAADSSGNLYISFEFRSEIMVVGCNGSKKTTISLPENAGNFPSDIFIWGNYLYVCEGNLGEVYRIKLRASEQQEEEELFF